MSWTASIVILCFSIPIFWNCSKPKAKTNSEIERLRPKKKVDDRDKDPDLSNREFFDEDAEGNVLKKKEEPVSSPIPSLRTFAQKGAGCKKGNCRNGEGIYVYDSGDVYSGRFSAEQREGWGRIAYSDGDSFEGNWSDDLKSGQGKYVFRDGTIFSGIFTGDGNGKGSYRKGGRTFSCRLENRKLFCKR
ncbi:hypothetical protein CH373_13660 [Leptospira perolatii]|uniref:Membrane-binding protein n=1 Tax=Leptospira perolatii TaxID=2023191 RepID=A0A2M9ZK84_9LEPT|nr:hypothetical protein [Leptospira perolatii]PJZ69324.1 hypothetical protein CH360_11225 [Leptospira perolatii]PJZ72459.1 hypothetical protein CH373_13660 [Leptospira perolatii]